MATTKPVDNSNWLANLPAQPATTPAVVGQRQIAGGFNNGGGGLAAVPAHTWAQQAGVPGAGAAYPGAAPGAGTGGQVAPPDWSGSNQYMGNVQNYLGQGTAAVGATANPYATAENPYLQSMVDKAGRDQRAYYDQFIAPKFSAGSSYGNSGLGFLEVNERNNQAQAFADQTNKLRFDEYGLRSGLAEQGANRQDQLNSGQRDNNITAGAQYGQLAGNAGQFNYSADYGQFADQQAESRHRIDALLRGMGANNATPPVTPAQQANPWAGAVGGALAGAQLYKQWNAGQTA